MSSRKKSPSRSPKRRRNTSTSPSRRLSPNWKAVKPKLTDRVMGYVETKAINHGLMEPRMYVHGATWSHGSPQRYRMRAPNTKDRIMGYLERRAIERGMMEPRLYADGRTWSRGQAAPYKKKSSSKRNKFDAVVPEDEEREIRNALMWASQPPKRSSKRKK